MREWKKWFEEHGREGDLTATFIYKQMWIMSVRMLSLDFECGSNFVEKLALLAWKKVCRLTKKKISYRIKLYFLACIFILKCAPWKGYE